jgi:hypothetical protein
MLFAFLLFAAQAFAQTLNNGLTAIESQYINSLGAVVDPLMEEMCDLVATTTIGNILEEIVEEMIVLLTYLELLMIAITGLNAEIDNILGGSTIGADLYGSSLPITDALTLITAAAADSILCLEIAAAILNAPTATWSPNVRSHPRNRISSTHGHSSYSHSCNHN